MPTGGITLGNVGEFLSLPSVVAAGGSWMVPADAIRDRDYERITVLAADAVKATRRP